MELEKFDKLHKIIIENFKAVGYKRIYEINDETFKPITYKDIYICASALNKDNNHSMLRLLNRTKYKFDDLLALIKLGIDEFYKNKYEDLFKIKKTTKFEKTEQNFCILSKSKKDIKICILISKNTAYDIFKDDNKEFYSSKYICFIHTILNKEMIPHKDDLKLFVENKENFITLYVD